jgi:D-lactate dehydrogenase
MNLTLFSAQPYDHIFFTPAAENAGITIRYEEMPLNETTAALVTETQAVSVFVNDQVNEKVCAQLAAARVRIIALRCAGFNNVNLEAARKYQLRVCRVPSYSPESVAEHAVAMILTLNRKTHKAYNRVREQNYSLNGLLGFNLFGKTVGVVGTGNIGACFCKIMLGFGCRVIAYDIAKNPSLEKLGVEYVPLEEVLKAAIVSLHCPLTPQTHHLINEQTLQQMQPGVMLINTSRGGLIDTKAVIQALKKGVIGYLGMDVYEQEENLFFKDLSNRLLEDETLQRLASFHNVLITAHQAFFTQEALHEIATTTLKNIISLNNGDNLPQQAAILV